MLVFYLILIVISLISEESGARLSSDFENNQSVEEIPQNLLKLHNISTEQVHAFQKSRLLLEDGVREPHHGKSWHDISEVNGLKNEEVIVFVTSTGTQSERLIWERFAIPS